MSWQHLQLPYVSVAVVSNAISLDDSVLNRKLLAKLLTNAGHKCDLAEDGKEALDLVIRKENAESCYDTVLLDFEMPVRFHSTVSVFVASVANRFSSLFNRL